MTLEEQMARELEGKFYTQDRKTGRLIDKRAAKPKKGPPVSIVRDWLYVSTITNIVDLDAILRLVGGVYEVSPNLLRNRIGDKVMVRASRRAARAKYAVCFLARKYTVCTLNEIAHYLGWREHSAAAGGNKFVKRNRTRFEPELSRCIAALEGRE